MYVLKTSGGNFILAIAHKIYKAIINKWLKSTPTSTAMARLKQKKWISSKTSGSNSFWLFHPVVEEYLVDMGAAGDQGHNEDHKTLKP